MYKNLMRGVKGTFLILILSLLCINLYSNNDTKEPDRKEIWEELKEKEGINILEELIKNYEKKGLEFEAEALKEEKKIREKRALLKLKRIMQKKRREKKMADLKKEKELNIKVASRLESKQKIFKNVGTGIISLGSSAMVIGLSALFTGIGLSSYGSGLLTQYGDSNLSSEENLKNPDYLTGTYYTSAGFYLILAGSITAGMGLVTALITIPFFVKSNFYKNLIEYQKSKSAVIIPYCSLGSNIECGISIKL